MNSPDKKLHPWPVAIIAYFAVFIAGIVMFTVFAARQKVDLVRTDYRDDEIRFQQHIDRLSRTKPLNAQVTITYDTQREAISLALPSAHAGRVTNGRVQLCRPSDASLDQTSQLVLDAGGAQQLDAKKLKAGLWKVRVSWRVDDQEYFFDQSIVVAPHQS